MRRPSLRAQRSNPRSRRRSVAGCHRIVRRGKLVRKPRTTRPAIRVHRGTDPWRDGFLRYARNDGSSAPEQWRLPHLFPGVASMSARPQFAATPSGRRNSDRTLEFPTEVIDVAKSARFGDLGKRRIVPDDEGLRIYETFPLQPSARARAQMPAKQPPDLRVAETRRCA